MTLVHLDEARDNSVAVAISNRVTLADELELWREAAEMASHIAQTEFVPAALRNKPAAVTAASAS